MRIIRQWPAPDTAQEQPCRFEPVQNRPNLAKGEWDNSLHPLVLLNAEGTQIRMGQAPDCWLPIWNWGDEEIRCSVSQMSQPGVRLPETERGLGDWEKEIGPICNVWPPPAWAQPLPFELAKRFVRDMDSGLRFFTRNYKPTGDWPARIVPVNSIVFSGQLAKFNGMKLE